MSDSPAPPAPPRPRTPREVIDAAIGENRKWDWLCYGLVMAFAAVGLGAVAFGALNNQMWPTIGGSVTTVVFLAPLYTAYRLWRENVALRVLEASLSDPKEAKATFEAFRLVYLARYKKGKS